MSKPSAKELLDGGWSNADMDELASRVEKVLALCKYRREERSGVVSCVIIERILNGEDQP